MSSTSPSSSDVSTRISVDGNDCQVIVAVEDPTPGGSSIVAAIDPLVDRQFLEQFVDELDHLRVGIRTVAVLSLTLGVYKQVRR